MLTKILAGLIQKLARRDLFGKRELRREAGFCALINDPLQTAF